MFHHPQRSSKTGRVVPKDTGNLGLHYSFQAQATVVNERPNGRQSSGDKKTPRDTEFLVMPSVSNPVITPSTKFRFSPGDYGRTTPTNMQLSAPDSSDGRQQQTFHELNKVQRQILHPVSAYMADTMSANLKATKEAKLPVRMVQSCGGTQPDRQFSDGQLPGDRVIFTESSTPGVPVVYRLPEDRHANPDRLNLDRRKLTTCPILEGEDNVRLLNFQHNLIAKIENLSQLKRLIFLDFYDNQLECISGLSSLKSLRVLMLGKNRIRKIEKLGTLTKLDVLDLHGNKISEIANLNHLLDLRVLNLAGNDIVSVDNLGGLKALAELNLRRNQITSVSEIDLLPNLQRLFLSFNCIQSFDDIRCISSCLCLSELSLDGNPFSLESSYKQTVFRNIPNLRQFDMRRITEDEKRTANIIAKKEDEKRREHGRMNHLKEKKRLAINNAQRQWEKFHISSPKPDESNIIANPESIPGLKSVTELSVEPGNQLTTTDLSEVNEVRSDMTISHLAELEGDTLFFYGPGSLDALERNWGQQAVNTIITVSFKFIDYDNIVPYLGKLQIKFPLVQKLVFGSTNIKRLPQINALAAIKHLECLCIQDGNPVTSFSLWKPYTLFRLAHLSLRKLNDIEITPEDIVKAEKLFGALSHTTTSYLPQSRLLSLLGTTRKNYNGDGEKQKRIETKHERSLSNEGLGRAGLQYQSGENLKLMNEKSKARKNFSVNYVKGLLQTCTSNQQKEKKLDSFLPQILAQIVHEYVEEMNDLDSFVANSLKTIKDEST